MWRQAIYLEQKGRNYPFDLTSLVFIGPLFSDSVDLVEK